MTLTKITKGYKAKWLICWAVSLLLTFGPVIGFGIYAMAVSGTAEKLALSLLSILSMAIAVVNVLFKFSFRSSIYVLLLGVSIALKEMTAVLIIVAICTALDDFVFDPRTKHYREKFSINKEIDRREQP